MLNDIWVYKKTSRIMLALLLIAVVMLSTQNWQLGLLLFIIIAGCIVYIKRCDFYQEKKLSRYLDDLSAGVSAGTVYAVKNLPVGIAMMDEKKELVWANNVFKNWIGKDAQEGVRFQNLVTGQKISKIWGKTGWFDCHAGGTFFRVFHKFIDVDIGGGTAEIAVISLGGIVASRSVRMAGDMFDQAIIAFIKRKYNLLIGERTAEQIKIEIGSAYALDPEMTMEIKGRNLVDGLPKNIVVHSEDVREALLECLVKITSAIKETLERTPPELSADIIDRGITLTGGGALLRGLDQLIQSETGIDVHIAEDPLDCVAKGAGAVLDHVDVLHDVLDTDGGHM